MRHTLITTFILIVIVSLTSASQSNYLSFDRSDGTFNIKELVTHLSRMTGKQFYLDPKVSGQITFIGRLPQTPNAMTTIVESILEKNGFFIQELNGIYHIVPKNKIEYDTELIKLKHLNVSEIKTALSSISPTTIFGGMVNSNVLLVRDIPSNIARIKLFIPNLDISRRKIEIVEIKNRSAEHVLKTMSQTSLLPSSDYHIQQISNQNRLLISAQPSQFNILTKLISEIDSVSKQVLIEAIIAEMSEDRALDIGSQWVKSFNQESASFQSSQPTSDTLGGLRLDIGSLFGSDVSAMIRFIQTSNGDTILSTPSLLTEDHQTASIVVGQNVPFLTGSYITSNNSQQNPFQTIERKDVGITLKVTPKIVDENVIRMQIEQEVSNLTTIRSQTSDVITNKRLLKTQIIVRNGQMIIMGGLNEKNEGSRVSQVPILGDIPILGSLFSHKQKDSLKRSLMIFIKPTIVSNPSLVETEVPKKLDLKNER